MEFEQFIGRLRHADTGAPLQLTPEQIALARLLHGENSDASARQLGRDLTLMSVLSGRQPRNLITFTTATD